MSECLVCGLPFVPSPRAKGSKQIYCSRKCRKKRQLKLQIAKDKLRRSLPKKVVTVTCAMCGAEFAPKRDLHKFCSPKCRYDIELIRARKRYRMKKLRQNDACDKTTQNEYLEFRIEKVYP